MKKIKIVADSSCDLFRLKHTEFEKSVTEEIKYDKSRNTSVT